MTDKLKTIVKEEMAKLPKENQEAVNAFDWAAITEEIGKKYLFDESEINDLQVETLLVLLGINEPLYFATNVENQVGTIKEVAKEISDDVTQRIFNPIYDAMVENIKKGDKVKNPNLEQNLDFILSGGDYKAFIPKNSPISEPSSEEEGNTKPQPNKAAISKEGNNNTEKKDDVKLKLVL
jgi:hypothetical protein